MIPRSSILLLMMPMLMLSDVPLTKVESGKLDLPDLPSSRRVAARFIGTPLRRQIRMIDRNNAMNEGEPPIRLRSPIKPMRNIYYYGDNQQLSRASGRFHNKVHAFPTHSIPQAMQMQDDAVLPPPPTYDPKRHHRDKLIIDDRVMSEAADMARGLERTTMRVRTFADIDVKKMPTTTTPLPAVSVTKMTKKEHQPVSSIDRTASVGSPSSSALGPPAPPLRSFAREQQRLLLQQQQQAPPLLAAPQQLQPIRILPTVTPPPLHPQIGPLIRHPAPVAPPILTLHMGVLGAASNLQQGGPPQQPPSQLFTPQPAPLNSQAPNATLEQLGCGWDWVSNSCKEVFTIGWCGQCHDFGNIFVHNCKCVQPLINVKALVNPQGRAA
ncbi:hypothetical protein PRIPAC_74347 [Pristionchus pacificus]|uniref:Uncharacterized protein n=1 Tax=Pristionchus pacificus TaxID=54126 RepID=A0A2A6CS47_PRIPA|nr:hypothetical protein PRIPAC_74347 [Pristionchus pacificus]|eukprot:PDM80887.1 hypothetical protein PRIPAC_35890 [Pristionchus pacificus]